MASPQPIRAQGLCERRGGLPGHGPVSVYNIGLCPGHPVSNKPYGFCGRKAIRKREKKSQSELQGCVVEEVDALSMDLYLYTI